MEAEVNPLDVVHWWQYWRMKPANAYDDLLDRYKSAAKTALPPIAHDLAEKLELDLTDEATKNAVGDALSAAFMQGSAVGNAEAVAQLVEGGHDANISVLTSDWGEGPST